MMDTLIRAFRKCRTDGIRPVAWEAGNLIAESAPSRKVVRETLLNDIRYIDYDDLCDNSKEVVRHKDTFQNIDWKSESEVSRKKRVYESKKFDELDTVSPYQPKVFELENVSLIHPFGIAIWNGCIIKELISPRFQGNSRIEKGISRTVKRHGYRSIRRHLRTGYHSSNQTIDVGIPLIPLWNNYYHWTIECLPRLASLKKYECETRKNPKILIPEEPPSWMVESLELAGVSESDRTELTQHLNVNNLVVPSYPRPLRIECEWTRETLRRGINSYSDHDRIYVTRRKATRRRVRNERALTKLLQKYGFKTYALEELTVREQVNLFSNANIVISPHGAGLANIVYADSLTVIELFGESKKTTFYRLAQLLDHEYHYLINTERHGDIIVDTHEIETLIDEISAPSS